MKHTATLKSLTSNNTPKSLLVQALGKFYTPHCMVKELIRDVISLLNLSDVRKYQILDPFCGDGRLLVEFISQISTIPKAGRIKWQVSFWDCDHEAVKIAESSLKNATIESNLNITLYPCTVDTFMAPAESYECYDCIITNPPWETIKPDIRHLREIPEGNRKEYIASLKRYDMLLKARLPHSQPTRKFAGWGTNLSRSGLEVSLKLIRQGGLCGIVTPLSLLTDQTSVNLRAWMFRNATIKNITYYPSEARLFDNVDQEIITSVLVKSHQDSVRLKLKRYNKEGKISTTEELAFDLADLVSAEYCVPVNFGRLSFDLMERFNTLKPVAELEGNNGTGLWLGRELDETRHQEFLAESGRFRFLKGRMVTRYSLVELPTHYVREDVRDIPESAQHYRIAWRDVSRRSQERRMQAAIIPPGIVTGNSLHVAYFRNNNINKLRVLLTVMNSVPFEFQVRAKLGTGHVSSGIVRQIRIPDIERNKFSTTILHWLAELEKGNSQAEIALEVLVAKEYGLDKPQFRVLLEQFEKIPHDTKTKILKSPFWLSENDDKPSNINQQILKNDNNNDLNIPNHRTAKLSNLDVTIALSVPPGGNWKNVSDSVPSERLKQIRESYTEGKGSRSTYYGRLHPRRPSYTINTHFCRPGNGCHLHYDFEGGQHRVISQREAARLQSFPDSFLFLGSQRSINTQIGNAVPPLLAYQIAKSLPVRGQYVDLFSGAGGLSLGFKWAGWKPLLANDIETTYLETYRHNIHDYVIAGSICEKKIFDQIVKNTLLMQKEHTELPLFVIGGPPCQGFSTAGNRRTMADERNHLFYYFKAIIDELKPMGFVFENVNGLQNMECGRVLELIKSELQPTVKSLDTWNLRSEEYGVPQRRSRLLLIGHSIDCAKIVQPKRVTYFNKQVPLLEDLAPAISVHEALSDLPPLQHGEDGSRENYLSEPANPYQALMRSKISPEQYIEVLKDRLTADQIHSSRNS